VSYLLDTNVISELVRTKPSPGVQRWFRDVPDEALHLSVLTLGEIRKGIERLGTGPRREKLRVWLERELPDWFEDRVLAVDAAVADRWGRLLFEVGRPVPAVGSLLAATALHHELRFVTRNKADFDYPGLEVVDPWTP
jgi:predicted nucleic acid-binding protein